MPIAMRRYQKLVLWFIIIPILVTFSIGSAIFSCTRQMSGGGMAAGIIDGRKKVTRNEFLSREMLLTKISGLPQIPLSFIDAKVFEEKGGGEENRQARHQETWKFILLTYQADQAGIQVSEEELQKELQHTGDNLLRLLRGRSITETEFISFLGEYRKIQKLLAVHEEANVVNPQEVLDLYRDRGRPRRVGWIRKAFDPEDGGFSDRPTLIASLYQKQPALFQEPARLELEMLATVPESYGMAIAQEEPPDHILATRYEQEKSRRGGKTLQEAKPDLIARWRREEKDARMQQDLETLRAAWAKVETLPPGALEERARLEKSKYRYFKLTKPGSREDLEKEKALAGLSLPRLFEGEKAAPDPKANPVPYGPGSLVAPQKLADGGWGLVRILQRREVFTPPLAEIVPETVIARYYRQHRGEFTPPEKRTAAVIWQGYAEVDAGIAITAAEAAACYDRVKDKIFASQDASGAATYRPFSEVVEVVLDLVRKEKRRFQARELENLKNAIGEEGENFERLAQEKGWAVAGAGPLTREEAISWPRCGGEEFARAIFDREEGKVGEVESNARGRFLVKVQRLEPGAVPGEILTDKGEPEVWKRLAQVAAGEKTREALNDLRKAALTDKAGLKKAAEAAKIPFFVTPDFVRQLEEIPELKSCSLIGPEFTPLKAGEITNPIMEKNAGYLLEVLEEKPVALSDIPPMELMMLKQEVSYRKNYQKKSFRTDYKTLAEQCRLQVEEFDEEDVKHSRNRPLDTDD